MLQAALKKQTEDKNNLQIETAGLAAKAADLLFNGIFTLGSDFEVL